MFVLQTLMPDLNERLCNIQNEASTVHLFVDGFLNYITELKNQTCLYLKIFKNQTPEQTLSKNKN